jgi:hypothetical protein
MHCFGRRAPEPISIGQGNLHKNYAIHNLLNTEELFCRLFFNQSDIKVPSLVEDFPNGRSCTVLSTRTVSNERSFCRQQLSGQSSPTREREALMFHGARDRRAQRA